MFYKRESERERERARACVRARSAISRGSPAAERGPAAGASHQGPNDSAAAARVVVLLASAEVANDGMVVKPSFAAVQHLLANICKLVALVSVMRERGAANAV